MRFLKQSTSVDVPIGPFVDQTDGFTAESGLTITQPDIRLKKNAAAWGQKNAAQTLTHEENGYYEVTLDATDTDTLGLLRLAVNEGGALPVWEDFMVMPANVWDSLFGADKLDVNVAEFGGSAGTFASGRPEVNATHLNGGALSGNNADVSLKSLNVTNSAGTAVTCSSGGGNGHGIAASGNGSGSGIRGVGGATGPGLQALGGATSGHGARFEGQGDGNGLLCLGIGNKIGIVAQGGASDGVGMQCAGVGSGQGLLTTSGTGIGFDHFDTIGVVVDDVSNSATTFKTDLSQTVDDYWKGCYCQFQTGTLKGQVKKITGYNGTTKFLSFTEGFTAEPTADDGFIIVNE